MAFRRRDREMRGGSRWGNDEDMEICGNSDDESPSSRFSVDPRLLQPVRDGILFEHDNYRQFLLKWIEGINERKRQMGAAYTTKAIDEKVTPATASELAQINMPEREKIGVLHVYTTITGLPPNSVSPSARALKIWLINVSRSASLRRTFMRRLEFDRIWTCGSSHHHRRRSGSRERERERDRGERDRERERRRERTRSPIRSIKHGGSRKRSRSRSRERRRQEPSIAIKAKEASPPSADVIIQVGPNRFRQLTMKEAAKLDKDEVVVSQDLKNGRWTTAKVNKVLDGRVYLTVGAAIWKKEWNEVYKSL